MSLKQPAYLSTLFGHTSPISAGRCGGKGEAARKQRGHLRKDTHSQNKGLKIEFCKLVISVISYKYVFFFKFKSIQIGNQALQRCGLLQETDCGPKVGLSPVLWNEWQLRFQISYFSVITEISPSGFLVGFSNGSAHESLKL